MNGKMLLDMATGEQGSINQSGKCGNTNGGQRLCLSSTIVVVVVAAFWRFFS